MAGDPTVLDEWDRPEADPTTTILLHSHDHRVRDAVRAAVGRRAAKDLPEIEWREVATPEAVIAAADGGGLDLLILDGEAPKNGGMGLCRQIKHEIYEAPPVLVLIGRAQDEWLAAWSEADAVVKHPIDPIEMAAAVAALVRAR